MLELSLEMSLAEARQQGIPVDDVGSPAVSGEVPGAAAGRGQLARAERVSASTFGSGASSPRRCALRALRGRLQR